MALVVFLQEDEDVPSVYRNLKIFCETAPCPLNFNLPFFLCLNTSFVFTIYQPSQCVLTSNRQSGVLHEAGYVYSIRNT